MLGALSEREEAGVRRPPGSEALHDGFEQRTRDATVPEIGPHRQRSERADAAPVRCEVRADDHTAPFRDERRRRIGSPTSADPIAVARKGQRIREAEKGPEREPEDPIGFAEVAFPHRSHRNVAHFHRAHMDGRGWTRQCRTSSRAARPHGLVFVLQSTDCAAHGGVHAATCSPHGYASCSRVLDDPCTRNDQA